MKQIKTKKFNIKETIILTCVVAGILAMVGFYVTQVNTLAVSGIQIAKINREIESLEESVENLKNETSKLQSADVLEQESQEMGMVRTLSSRFVNITGGVALR